MMIPWYYMWSNNYRFFHQIMQDTINDSRMPLRPLEIPEGRFYGELYKAKDAHYWKGSSIKVESILIALYEATQDSLPYILFTDIDIIVKPGVYDELQKYIDDGQDMVFIKDTTGLSISGMLLRVSTLTTDFWKRVISDLQKDYCLDQDIVNECIKDFSGKWKTFDSKFILSENWDQKSDFKIMHLPCTLLGKELNMAERIFTMAQHVDLEPYMKYVDEDIIPYIYTFQELLYKSHQELNHVR